jgi:hypothetical protein
VRGGEVPIVSLKIFNLIFLEAPRCAKVEVAGVFIPEGAIFNFRPLPPVGGTFEVFLAEMGFCQGTKVLLEGGEGAVFLQPVKKGDDGTTVEQVDGWQPSFPGPGAGSSPDPFEAKAKSTDRREVRVVWTDAIPVASDKVGKSRMGQPGVFHTEDGTSRGLGGGFKVDRNMVRGGAGRRG